MAQLIKTAFSWVNYNSIIWTVIFGSCLVWGFILIYFLSGLILHLVK
jgi:hypothetical protein